MDDTTNPKIRGIDSNEVRGKFPAWLWKGIWESERSARGDRFLATVLKDGSASFVLVEANDWSEILRQERQFER